MSDVNSGAYLDIPSGDGGAFQAYVARPERGSGPALVLLQEIFGINDFMREQADLLAAEGYVAIVPDLFWRIEPGIQLSYSEADFTRAMELGRAIDLDKAVEDIQATITHSRTMAGVAGQVGVLGFCLGGRLAFLAAARTDAAVAVSYYGVGIDTHLEELDNITCPLVLHFPAEDRFCPPDAQQKVLDAVTGKDNVWFYTYEGQDHGFAATGREHFHKPSANVALSRSLDVLRREIGPIYRYEDLWDEHCALEFEHRDVDATMETMIPTPYVNHIPTLAGGVGHDHLKRFYKYHFVDANPDDTKLILLSRTVGANRLVEEQLFCFTHDREIDWMLPGIAPTGNYVEVPVVAVVTFRGDKLMHEHIYWDQASVLVQIGLLDPEKYPVAGIETAQKLADETRPSNILMQDQWATSEGKPL